MNSANRAQILALHAYRTRNGRNWKSLLKQQWANGTEEVCKEFGPEWLDAFHFPIKECPACGGCPAIEEGTGVAYTCFSCGNSGYVLDIPVEYVQREIDKLTERELDYLIGLLAHPSWANIYALTIGAQDDQDQYNPSRDGKEGLGILESNGIGTRLVGEKLWQGSCEYDDQKFSATADTLLKAGLRCYVWSRCPGGLVQIPMEDPDTSS